MFSLLAIYSCDDPEIMEMESAIASDFELEGTWNFQTVEGEGEIFGSPQMDKDNMPTGFVQFNSDGTGISEFSINLLNQPYSKEEQILWERTSDSTVVVTQSDGDIDNWVLIRANDELIEASWDIIISEGNFATITSVLTAAR